MVNAVSFPKICFNLIWKTVWLRLSSKKSHSYAITPRWLDTGV